MKVLDKGSIELVWSLGDDTTPSKVARTSFHNSDEVRTYEQDMKLVKYLYKHRHTTPFEFIQLQFYIKCPMFVGEQILRHRTASINKVSGRYVEFKPEFYVPAAQNMNEQSKNNKQGRSEEVVAFPNIARNFIITNNMYAYRMYQGLLNEGVAYEIARMVLPANLYTEFFWSIDMHNFLHFSRLRMDSHAQWETRQYANAAFALASEKFPGICQIFTEESKNG